MFYCETIENAGNRIFFCIVSEIVRIFAPGFNDESGNVSSPNDRAGIESTSLRV